MANPSSPAAENDPKRAWRAVVDAIEGGEASLGERLYLLGAGPVPVEGASGGAITLDARGGVVLVVGLDAPSATAGDQIARQLQALTAMPGTKLREAGVDPASGGGLAARHAAYFGLAEPVELNTGQRCVVVLAGEPAGDALEPLTAALGASLAGTFVASETGLAPLRAEPEEEIVLEPEAPAETEAPAEETAPEVEEAPAEAEAPAEETAPEVEEAPAEAEAPAEEPPAETEAPVEDTAPEADEAPEELEVPAEGPDEAAPEGPVAIEVAIDSETSEAEVPVEEEEDAPDLVAPYLADESTTVIVEEGPEGATAPGAEERTGRLSSWPIGNWIGLTMVLVGIVLAVIGILSLREPQPEPATNDEIRTVASSVTPDATHARWIGQQRVVTLSDGTLVFVYPTGDSLNLVEDNADVGDTWQEPFVLEDLAATSFSVDVDSKDRLHVAYSDGASVNYVRLKDKPAGWKPSRLIQLDDDTTSLHVDVAWDEQNQTAHVVWVQQSDEGEAPAWAALTNEGGIQLTQEGLLTDPGTDVPVLVAVAADGRASLLMTYRRGDQVSGWSSRYSGGRLSDGSWSFNEEEQVGVSGHVGAVDVVYDRQKTAHLVLRDDDAKALTYFTKTGGEPWSEGETAVQGKTVQDVEFPVLSYNAGEANLYLFFQTEEFDPAGEINYVVQALGGTTWQGPFDITNPADAPEGALYPVAPDRVSVRTIVFWTKTGDPYVVDSAPVSGPQQSPQP